MLQTAYNYVRRIFHTFLTDTCGGIAVTFSLILPVLLGSVALSVDYANHQRSRLAVQAALDASALWLAQRGNQIQAKATSSESSTDTALQSYFELNLNSNYKIDYENLQGQWGEGSLLVSVDLTTQSLFSIMSFNETLETQVAWADELLEIALVIDTTEASRFKGNKTAIQDAIAAFLDTYEGMGSRIGVIPFSDTINVGADFHNMSMDVSKKAKYNGANINKTATEGAHTTLFDQLDEGWGGCLEARPFPYDETDEAPSGIDDDSYWVPFLHPSDPENTYLKLDAKEVVNSTDITKSTKAIWDASYYIKSKYLPILAASPNAHCNQNQILDLTESLGTVERHVNNLVYEGDSIIHLGVLWAWRLLSPSAPYDRGKSYSDPNVKKVVVLITDGTNKIPLTHYSTYGYLSEGRLGTTNLSKAQLALNEKTLRVCLAARQEGIDIFTLGIATEDMTYKGREAMTSLLGKCAGDGSNSLVASTPEELSSSLSSISNRLSAIRIVR